MAIDATPGGASSNSFGTLAEADAYFLNHPNADTWIALIEQEELLIHATRLLGQQEYIGDRATTTQALPWPRVINDLYGINHDVFPFASNEVPTKMKYAQFETTMWLAQSGGAAIGAGAISEMQIGKSVNIKYSVGSSSGFIDTSVDPSGLPIQAARYLKGLRLVSVLA